MEVPENAPDRKFLFFNPNTYYNEMTTTQTLSIYIMVHIQYVTK